MATDCPFCKIVSGEGAADIVLETTVALAFVPLEPATKGHTLVIPKTHYPTAFSVPMNDQIAVHNLVMQVAMVAHQSLGSLSYQIITQVGAVAGQTIRHAHWHLVPRWKDDAMGDIWPRGDKAISPSDRVAYFIQMQSVVGGSGWDQEKSK